METRGIYARKVSHQSNSDVKSDSIYRWTTASSVSIDSEEIAIDSTAHTRGPQLQCMGTPSKLPNHARGLQGQCNITPSKLSSHLRCAHEQYADDNGSPSKLPSHIRDDGHTSRPGKTKQPDRRFSVPEIILSLTISVFFIGIFLSHHSIKKDLSDEIHSPGFLSDFKLSKTLISGMNKTSHEKDTLSPQSTTVAEILVEEKGNRIENQTANWENSSKLPQWMKAYFAWHTEQRKAMNESNWESFQYLILRCSEKDGKCGGLADRLKPIPLFLLMAARTNRIFMIRWTKPCRLEEFMVPNEGGINWSVPTWMEEKLQKRHPRSFYARTKETMEKLKVDKTVVAETRMQDAQGGAVTYNAMVATNITGSGRAKDANRDDYDEIYHDLFRAMFRPVAPIQNLINKKLESTGLLPGEFAVAHYRAFYAVEHEKDKVSEELLIERAVNSVNCASRLRPGGPVYFASDSKFALEEVKKYASQTNRSIVSLDGPEALHLDKENDRPPSDFYPVFVDLYLMGSGRCLSFGKGGFGRYGLLMSYNATCSNRHFYKGKIQRCDWTDAL